MSYKIGVLGSGSFGTAIARLLSAKKEVLMYTRRDSVLEDININHRHKNVTLSPNIKATNNIAELGDQCRLIFPVIPSEFFREVIRDIAPYVGPGHMMIHGTKGLDVSEAFHSADSIKEIKKSVFTMTEVITQESSILRTGALAGPNLAKEILEGQPAATVISSNFDELIEMGRDALSTKNFIVYGSKNLKGVELAGALKNVIAIASGIMNKTGFGKNMQALLITRGLREMIHIAKSVGAEARPFLGTSGIGDLIATATSTNSRNYTFGGYLAEGKTVEEIKSMMDEVAEGYRTIKFAYKITKAANLDTPIINMLYSITYENRSLKEAIKELIRNPLVNDVDFI